MAPLDVWELLKLDGIGIKGAALFLASEASSHVTGHYLIVVGLTAWWSREQIMANTRKKASVSRFVRRSIGKLSARTPDRFNVHGFRAPETESNPAKWLSFRSTSNVLWDWTGRTSRVKTVSQRSVGDIQ